MIPFQLALIAYIGIAAVLMADRNAARGFSLAFILGYLLLPEARELDFSGIPDVGKENVWAIGALIGTFFFHPEVFDRFRPNFGDLLLLISLQLTFFTSYINGFGVYDGISQSIEFLLTFALPIFLARIHLGTPGALRTFLLVFTIAAAAYVPLALYEFRMSPQIHTTIYGYFQHVFQQHARGAFWRPIGFFSHALHLGRFFAFAAFLAMLPLRNDLTRLLGTPGRFLFIAPLLGLIASQSLFPMFLFITLCAGYYVIEENLRIVYILPAIALVWLLLNFVGVRTGDAAVDFFRQFTEARAGSLQYRLDALSEYESVVRNQPFFGYGGWGHGRIEGRATDSQALISLLSRGFVGTFFYMGWWVWALIVSVSVMRRTNGSALGDKVSAGAIMLSLALSIIVIDAALDQHVLILSAAIVGLAPLLEEHARQRERAIPRKPAWAPQA